MARWSKPNPDAARELQEFAEKIQRYGLREVLTDQALMLLFLMLGSAMWADETRRPHGGR